MPKSIEWLEVATLSSGMPLRLPVHKIVGEGKGPVLGLTATIHGDEILPIEIIRQVFKRVDEKALKGTVLAMPVCNPLAVQNLMRPNPGDKLNLNRVFPGDPNGYLSERIAYTITEKFLKRVNYLVDFHSGASRSIADYMFVFKDRDFGLAFGLENNYAGSPPDGSSLKAAEALGVTATTVELGGMDIACTSYVEKGVKGVLNVMKHTGMLQGSTSLPKEQRIFSRKTTLRPGVGGLLYSRVFAEDIGRTYPKGEVMGEVISPYTFETVEELKAPYGKNLLIHVPAFTTMFEAGEYAYQLADMDGAEIIRR